MGYTVLSRSQLALAVPKLAELSKDGFIAAYEGPGGVYVVTSPRVAAGMQIGAKPVQLITYVSQPTMVLVPGRRWEEGAANACAQALAMQEITARRDGTTLVLDPKDVAKLLGEVTEAPADGLDPAAFAPPIAKLLGMRAVSLGDGAATIEMEVDDRHANPAGSLHGGIVCDVADFAMGAACKTALAADESFTTLELKINFIKPVWKSILRAHAKVKKHANGIVLVECTVVDEHDGMVAFATSTCIVLRS